MDRALWAPWNQAMATGEPSTYLQRCMQVLGRTDVFFDFDDMERTPSAGSAPMGWGTSFIGSGSSTNVGLATNYPAGVYRIGTGATAASRGALTQGGTRLTTQNALPWYFACRFQTLTAFTAQSVIGAFLRDLGNFRTVGVGVIGASSSNYVIQYDGTLAGSVVDLGVAVDLNTWHTFEIWSPGAAPLFGRIDGGAVRSATQTLFGTTYQVPFVATTNGTDPTDRAMLVDWVAIGGCKS